MDVPVPHSPDTDSATGQVTSGSVSGPFCVPAPGSESSFSYPSSSQPFAFCSSSGIKEEEEDNSTAEDDYYFLSGGSDFSEPSDEESFVTDSSDDEPPPCKKTKHGRHTGAEVPVSIGFDYQYNPERPGCSGNFGNVRDRHGWIRNLRRIDVHQFEGSEPYGPAMDRPADDSPLEYFLSFFPMVLFSKIARYTNICGSSNPNFTKPTTPAEIKAWVGIRIIQGVHPNTNCDDDWSTHPGLRNPLVASTMTRARFNMISEVLACTNPTKEQKTDKDKDCDMLYPLQLIWDTVIQACRTNYNPRKELSLDEVMIKSNTKQSFMPMKPTKTGFKIYAVCEARSGYLLNMMVHYASEHKTKDTCLRLMEPFLGQYHQVFTTKQHTSPALAKDLLVNQTYLCGDVKLTCKGLPEDFHTNPDLSLGRHPQLKLILKAPRGTTYTWQQGQMTMVLWRGTKVVSLLSTCHQGYRDEATDFITKNIREKGEKTASKKDFPAPPHALDYIKFKGGVEHANQIRSYNSCNRQGKAWKRILYFLIDTARVNAWICYKVNTEGQPGVPLTHRMFTVNIATSLIAGFAEGTPAYQPSMTPVPAVNGPNHVCIRMKAPYPKMCIQCRNEGRKTPKGHAVTTRTGCISCNIHLCRDHCFLAFHSAAN